MMTLRDLEGCRIVRAAIVGDSPTLTLDNGATVIAQRDEEGNGPGHLEIDFDGTACGRDEESRGEHTPGPWVVDGRAVREATPTGKVPGVPLATTAYAGPYSLDEADANARLIAAAPAMLEALRDCVATLGRFHPETTAYKLACEALAMAEGE